MHAPGSGHRSHSILVERQSRDCRFPQAEAVRASPAVGILHREHVAAGMLRRDRQNVRITCEALESPVAVGTREREANPGGRGRENIESYLLARGECQRPPVAAEGLFDGTAGVPIHQQRLHVGRDVVCRDGVVAGAGRRAVASADLERVDTSLAERQIPQAEHVGRIGCIDRTRRRSIRRDEQDLRPVEQRIERPGSRWIILPAGIQDDRHGVVGPSIKRPFIQFAWRGDGPRRWSSDRERPAVGGLPDGAEHRAGELARLRVERDPTQIERRPRLNHE